MTTHWDGPNNTSMQRIVIDAANDKRLHQEPGAAPRGNGVAYWPCSIVAGADCIEVTGSRVGLIFNREAYGAIATGLARPALAE
jgi:hypothetical protein